VTAITARRERAARLQRHNIGKQILNKPKETIMSTQTNTKLSKRPRTSGHELSEHQLESVTGGRIGPGPLALNPQPLPPG
jgi:hypothetical protein